jgi:hypothetical protein
MAVKSVEEFKKLHLKDVKKKIKEQRKKIDIKIEIVKESRHPDTFKSIVQEKLDKDGLSYSSLKSFRESPISFIEYLTREKKPKTPSLILGSVADEIVTNQKGFHKKIFVMPEKVSAKSNEGKAIKELYEELNQGLLVVDEETFEKGYEIAESVWKNDDSRFYLERTKRFQVPLRFKHRETGYFLRGFIDMESEEEPRDHEYFIADLKTVQVNKGHQLDWPRQVINFWYNGQTGVYTMGYKYKWKFPSFVHIVVETSPPYNVNVFRATQDMITGAQEEIQNLLLSFKYCHENNLWHKSYDFVRDEALSYFSMDVPAYYKPRM